jgi:hypothetical protein
VIHEHEDLLLASAGMEFGLTDAEAERLARAIDDCPVCAERATAYRRQNRLLAGLPVIEPSAALRRRVQAAALSGGRPQTRSPLILLAAALAIGAVLAVGAAIGGAFRERPLAVEFPPNDLPSAPTESGPPAATPSPSDVIVTPPPGSTNGPLPVLGKDTVAEVITDNLRIRSEPRIAADSIKFEPFLDPGDRLFVVDGPVSANEHDWYQVAAWRPTDPELRWPIGWVATGDVDGVTAWIAPASVSCPAAPTVDGLALMNRYEALACFGDRPIAFRALVTGTDPTEPCPADPVGPCLGGPTWLAGVNGRVGYVDAAGLADVGGAPGLAIARNPDGPVGENDLPPDRLVEIRGAFDDPASTGCSLVGAPTSVSTLTVSEAILRCRTTFVVSAVVPEPAGLSRQAPAITTTDDLRVRSAPVVDATSERYEPLLARGSRLFVLDGPVLGSGYTWYRVLAPTVIRTGGEPMTGWVAVAGKDGEIWAQDVDLACPPTDQPVAFADLVRLGTGTVPDGGVGCFGNVPVTITATVTPTCTGVEPTGTGWLAAAAGISLRLTDGDLALDARVHPDGVDAVDCATLPTGRATVTGHFDDEDATSCGTRPESEAAGTLAVYRCRTVFVVTELAPAP